MLNEIKTRKPGRPRISETSAKDSLIGARFGDDERKKIDRAVKASKLNKSEWIRKTLLSEAGRSSETP